MSSEQIEIEGPDHVIIVADDCVLGAPVAVRGCRNQLTLASGADVSSYALTGPAGTLAEPPPGQPCLIIQGEDNSVVIGPGCRLRVSMVVRGSGNRIHIGADCQLNGLLNIATSGATLTIGDGSTMVRGSIQMHEPAGITVGRDCMFSSEVYLSVSDIHPIHDAATGARINSPASITIGDHVWLGLRAMVMKGSVIGDGAVVAAAAVVAGPVEGGSVAAGVPARVVRRGIVWRRDFAEAASVVAESPESS